MDWLIVWWMDRRPDWMNDCMIDGWLDELIDWWTDWLINFNDWLMVGWMDGWVIGWMGEWMDGWMDGWVIGWMGEGMDGWMDGWAIEWMGDWMDGWLDGWISNWIGGLWSPMHLGPNRRALCAPYRIIGAVTPRLKILMTSGSKTGTQIYYFFISIVPTKEPPPGFPAGPRWREILVYRAFAYLYRT